MFHYSASNPKWDSTIWNVVSHKLLSRSHSVSFHPMLGFLLYFNHSHCCGDFMSAKACRLWQMPYVQSSSCKSNRRLLKPCKPICFSHTHPVLCEHLLIHLVCQPSCLSKRSHIWKPPPFFGFCFHFAFPSYWSLFHSIAQRAISLTAPNWRSVMKYDEWDRSRCGTSNRYGGRKSTERLFRDLPWKAFDQVMLARRRNEHPCGGVNTTAL